MTVHAELEWRIGRKLTAAERHIDILAIDRLLNEAKDMLDAEIGHSRRDSRMSDPRDPARSLFAAEPYCA